MWVQKLLWKRLAKREPNYYVLGIHCDEEEFRKTGRECAEKHTKDLFGKILEIGCGTGRMTEFIEGEEVVGIDISGEMIRLAKQRFSEGIFLENDGIHISYPDGYFDCVFSYMVYQHFKSYRNIVKSFKEVYRVLNKDGLFKVQLRGQKTQRFRWYSGVVFDLLKAKKLCLKTNFIIEDYIWEGRNLWLWLKKK